MLFLLDASALLNDPNFRFLQGNQYVTTPLIMNEWKTIETRGLAENALHENLLKIEEPDRVSEDRLLRLVKQKGFTKLSKADLSLLSLALQYKSKRNKFLVITDDFSIQNFLKILNVPFSQAIQGKINKILSFKILCPGCSRIFKDPSLKICEFCGSKLKKQPVFE